MAARTCCPANADPESITEGIQPESEKMNARVNRGIEGERSSRFRLSWVLR